MQRQSEYPKTSRELIQQNGWAGVNIRSVAAACGSRWVHLQLLCIQDRTAECHGGKHLGRYLPPSGERSGLSRYLVLRPVDVSAAGGRQPEVSGLLPTMRWALSGRILPTANSRCSEPAAHSGSPVCVLQNDAKIRADAFTEEFTVEKFAETLFSLMLSARCGRTLTLYRAGDRPASHLLKHPTKLWDVLGRK